MYVEKHASLGMCVRGNNKLGETRILATPVSDLQLKMGTWPVTVIKGVTIFRNT